MVFFLHNKRRYLDESARSDAELITILGPHFRKTSPTSRPVRKPNGGSILRIYRDIRFSTKTSRLSRRISQRNSFIGGKERSTPRVLPHIAPGESFFGAGLWRPRSRDEEQVAGAIVAHPGKIGALQPELNKFRSYWD